MATAQEAAFTPTATAQLPANSVSSQITLPTTGTPTIVRVTNMGPLDAFVLLGGSGVVATIATGLVLLARTSIYLVIGANTNLAAISQGNGVAVLRIEVGN